MLSRHGMKVVVGVVVSWTSTRELKNLVGGAHMRLRVKLVYGTLRSEGGACRHQANISTFLSWASDPQDYECYNVSSEQSEAQSHSWRF